MVISRSLTGRVTRGLLCTAVMTALLFAPLSCLAAGSRFQYGAHVAAWTATTAPAATVRAGARVLRLHVTPSAHWRSTTRLRRTAVLPLTRPADIRSVETLPTHWGAVHLLI